MPLMVSALLAMANCSVPDKVPKARKQDETWSAIDPILLSQYWIHATQIGSALDMAYKSLRRDSIGASRAGWNREGSGERGWTAKRLGGSPISGAGVVTRRRPAANRNPEKDEAAATVGHQHLRCPLSA